MCTVSYLPNNDLGFIITSNRDEDINRRSDIPKKYIYKGQEVIFPKDSKVFGSWIACTANKVVCLLNGAYEAHKRKVTYARSRGELLLDALVSENLDSFLKNNHLSEIEPFTLIYASLNGIKLSQLVWDGKEAHLKRLNEKEPAFWSSATLYNQHWREIRNSWFQEWLKSADKITADDIMKFHKDGGESNSDNGFIMSRNGGKLKTISITQVQCQFSAKMTHWDLIDGLQITEEF